MTGAMPCVLHPLEIDSFLIEMSLDGARCSERYATQVNNYRMSR